MCAGGDQFETAGAAVPAALVGESDGRIHAGSNRIESHEDLARGSSVAHRPEKRDRIEKSQLCGGKAGTRPPLDKIRAGKELPRNL